MCVHTVARVGSRQGNIQVGCPAWCQLKIRSKNVVDGDLWIIAHLVGQ